MVTVGKKDAIALTRSKNNHGNGNIVVVHTGVVKIGNHLVNGHRSSNLVNLSGHVKLATINVIVVDLNNSLRGIEAGFGLMNVVITGIKVISDPVSHIIATSGINSITSPHSNGKQAGDVIHITLVGGSINHGDSAVHTGKLLHVDLNLKSDADDHVAHDIVTSVVDAIKSHDAQASDKVEVVAKVVAFVLVIEDPISLISVVGASAVRKLDNVVTVADNVIGKVIAICLVVIVVDVEAISIVMPGNNVKIVVHMASALKQPLDVE